VPFIGKIYGIMAKYLKYLIVLSALLQNLLLAQIKVTSLPQNTNGIFDPVFFDSNEYRNVELLNSGWQVYSENDIEKKTTVSVPAIFEGEETLVFEKKIKFTEQQIQNSQLILGFLGLNYSAEISINGYNIYKHSGGSYPFEVPLPKDILKENSTVTVKVSSKLNSENSIPSTQRFLFSSLSGGIFRDVYIKTVPPLHITSNSFTYSFDQAFTKTSINFKIGIENSTFQKSSQISQSKEIIVRINLIPNGSAIVQVKGDFVQIISAEDNEANIRLELINPQLWSPQTPNNYLCEVSLINNGELIDKTVKQISFYQIKKDENNFLLNGIPFVLEGTTYLFDESSLRRMNAYDKIKDDLTLIKNTGFNSVRFSKSYPNPYAVKLCQELGLFAFIELPLNSVPEDLLMQNDFQLHTVQLLKSAVSNYSEYGNTIIIGVGSSLLPNSEITQNFLSQVSGSIKEKGFFTYASFVGVQTTPIKEIDFYGIELYSPLIANVKEEFQKGIDALGKNSIFVSEVTYPNYKGNQSGYLTKYSSDAQAKYFGELINLTRELKISGFFINSLFDYKGEFASLYGSYSENGFYKFGILDYARNLNSIGYKVIAAKLSNDAKVTIPIGTRKDDNPIIFIFLALFLFIVMAVLINTKKKFREDCTRALLRPYNFFADVRDHRIMSGIHTAILLLIQAGSASLLITILLFYYRTNILLEKFVIAIGHHSLLKLISYLAWNLQSCFVFLFALFILKFVLMAAVIKFASFFIKTRVEFASILYTVVWSFLPLILLLPVELILFKLLINGTYETAILIFLILYFLWILQRIFKGIYVVFDVRPLMVYLYSFAAIVLVVGGILLKYQLTSSTYYYIVNSIKQYNSMIF
jgi:beta-galactosidase